MHIQQRVAGGFVSILCLGILLGAAILPLQAGGRVAQLTSGENASRQGVCSLACRKPDAHPMRRQRLLIGERPSANGRSQSHLSTAAPPYPSARWRLSVAAHRSPLTPCPSSGVMEYGLGPTVPGMAAPHADLLLPVLRAAGVVALLPP